jgi:hypothetical protein
LPRPRKNQRSLQVLEAVNAIDAALIKDDHAAFAALLAKDLVVSSPQNSISIRGRRGEELAGKNILVI